MPLPDPHNSAGIACEIDALVQKLFQQLDARPFETAAIITIRDVKNELTYTYSAHIAPEDVPNTLRGVADDYAPENQTELNGLQ